MKDELLFQILTCPDGGVILRFGAFRVELGADAFRRVVTAANRALVRLENEHDTAPQPHALLN